MNKCDWSVKHRNAIMRMVSNSSYNDKLVDVKDIGQKWDEYNPKKYIHEFEINGVLFQVAKAD